MGLIQASLTRRFGFSRCAVPALKGRPKVIPSLRDEVGLAPYRANGRTDQIYLHGGIRPYVLRQLLAGTTGF